MTIRPYDGQDAAERERQARVMGTARDVLAKRQGMVADIDPAVIRERAIAVVRAGLGHPEGGGTARHRARLPG